MNTRLKWVSQLMDELCMECKEEVINDILGHMMLGCHPWRLWMLWPDIMSALASTQRRALTD
jgi:hypothetical protein